MKIAIALFGSLVLSVFIADHIQTTPPLFGGLLIGIFAVIYVLLNRFWPKKKVKVIERPISEWSIRMVYPTEQKNHTKFKKVYKDEFVDYDDTPVDEITIDHKIEDHTILGNLDGEWVEIGTITDEDLNYLKYPSTLYLTKDKDTGFYFMCDYPNPEYYKQ